MACPAKIFVIGRLVGVIGLLILFLLTFRFNLFAFSKAVLQVINSCYDLVTRWLP